MSNQIQWNPPTLGQTRRKLCLGSQQESLCQIISRGPFQSQPFCDSVIFKQNMVLAHAALWRLRAWIAISLGIHRFTGSLLVLSVLILLQFEILLYMACSDCCKPKNLHLAPLLQNKPHPQRNSYSHKTVLWFSLTFWSQLSVSVSQVGKEIQLPQGGRHLPPEVQKNIRSLLHWNAKVGQSSLFLSLALVPGNNAEYQLMVFSLQSPLNHPVMKMSIETPAVYQPAVGYGLHPLGCKVLLSRKSAVKIIPSYSAEQHLSTTVCTGQKKLGCCPPPSPPITLVPFCVWAAPPGFWHPALWILPWFCPTVTIVVTPSFVPINIYLALLPCFLPLQAHGPGFSLPRICGSL